MRQYSWERFQCGTNGKLLLGALNDWRTVFVWKLKIVAIPAALFREILSPSFSRLFKENNWMIVNDYSQTGTWIYAKEIYIDIFISRRLSHIIAVSCGFVGLRRYNCEKLYGFHLCRWYTNANIVTRYRQYRFVKYAKDSLSLSEI